MSSYWYRHLPNEGLTNDCPSYYCSFRSSQTSTFNQNAVHILIFMCKERLTSDATLPENAAQVNLYLSSSSVIWCKSNCVFLEKSLRRLSRAIFKKCALSLLNPASVSFKSDAFSSLKGRASFSLRGVDTKPSLSPLVAILKCLYWNYLKSETFEFAGLLATVHYSSGCWNGIYFNHTNYFGRRALFEELCAQ